MMDARDGDSGGVDSASFWGFLAGVAEGSVVGRAEWSSIGVKICVFLYIVTHDSWMDES